MGKPHQRQESELQVILVQESHWGQVSSTQEVVSCGWWASRFLYLEQHSFVFL